VAQKYIKDKKTCLL